MQKTAIVTGASKGIGKAVALRLAEAGMQVVVSSRKVEAVQQVVDEIHQKGGKALAIAAHMGDVRQIEALLEATIAWTGGVNCIVNNAAANPVFGPVIHTDLSAFDKIMDVNVKGPFYLAKLAYPYLEKQGGSVINISSVGGLSPEDFLGIYSVSKAALISLSKVMAKEWAPVGIRVNVVCPGLIQTKFSQALWDNEQILHTALQRIPQARMGQPEEVASLIHFLTSPEASYCNGGVYTVDGGYTI